MALQEFQYLIFVVYSFPGVQTLTNSTTWLGNRALNSDTLSNHNTRREKKKEIQYRLVWGFRYTSCRKRTDFNFLPSRQNVSLPSFLPSAFGFPPPFLCRTNRYYDAHRGIHYLWVDQTRMRRLVLVSPHRCVSLSHRTSPCSFLFPTTTTLLLRRLDCANL